MDGALLPEKAKVWDGRFYLDLETVKNYFDERFYANAEEGILLYTSANEVVRAVIGETSYLRHAEAGATAEIMAADYTICRMESDTLYVALDYVRNFANFNDTSFKSPARLRVETKSGTCDVAILRSGTKLRVAANAKAPIIARPSKGTRVTLLSETNEWAEILTDDGWIGFVEKRRIGDVQVKTREIAQNYTPPPYTDLTRADPVCLVWHQISVPAASVFPADKLADAAPVNVISPTWFSVTDASGIMRSLASKEYVRAAHARGMAVWACVKDTDSELDRHALLSNSASRTALINALADAAKTYGFDGINLDFELVPVADGEHFTQFLRELSIVCRREGLVFSVDNYVPRPHSKHYNRPVQGEVADYVVIMGYDEHWSGSSSAGPVASLGFVQSGIERTLEVVPERKVINALPFYARVWETGTDGVDSRALGMSGATEWASSRGLTPVWDESTGMDYAGYEADGILYQVWLENKSSIEAKLKVMKAHQLGGVAAWRLGLETPDIWQSIAHYLTED
jgi:spore germination protein YaaH